MKKIWVVIWQHYYGVDTFTFRDKKNAQIIHDRLDSLIDNDPDYDGSCEILEEDFMEDNENFDPKTFKFI